MADEDIRVIDSHTGGEPTRVVIAGGPDLGSGTLAERREIFHRQHDDFRATVVNEPRGSDVLVGAILGEPCDRSCAAGVIFFNNVGVLNMCGHGTIGLAVTLGHLGRIGAGRHRIETPVGVVTVEYDGANAVTFDNVPSYRYRRGVAVTLAGGGTVQGDIAWGGNWFFLCSDHGLELTLANVERLTARAWEIRHGLEAAGITGAEGGHIDHIELIGPPRDGANHGRNFVLCPGGAYDRSPCGTGTSAKLACLHADGKLRPGEVWRQESILGTVFAGTVRPCDVAIAGCEPAVIPSITGTAYVTAEGTLLRQAGDPFRAGIRA